MEVLTCENYIFTEFPVNSLKKKGFTVSDFKKDPSNGVERASLYIRSSSDSNQYIELRFINIIDELLFQKSWEKERKFHPTSPRLYLKTKVKDLETKTSELDFPCIINSENELRHHNSCIPHPSLLNHPNQTVSFEGIYFYHNQELELKSPFFQARATDPLFLAMKLRKTSDFWAIVVCCESIEHFKQSTHSSAQETFYWKNKKAVHLKEGPNDWDILCFEK